MSIENSPPRQAIREALLAAYDGPGLWGVSHPEAALPQGVERGSDAHLAFLTLAVTISGGRDPDPFWLAARQTYAAQPDLFAPPVLATAKAAALVGPLKAHGLLRKQSNATVWQRIGQALVMRAGGSVSSLLAQHNYDVSRLLALLAQNKTTFPVLSGAQTGPRWLYLLATAGAQPLPGAGRQPVPASAAAARALQSLRIDTQRVQAASFAALDRLGAKGCIQRDEERLRCGAAPACPVAAFCPYGQV